MQSADGNIQIQAAAIVEAQLEKGLFPDRLLDSVREQHGLLLELGPPGVVRLGVGVRETVVVAVGVWLGTGDRVADGVAVGGVAVSAAPATRSSRTGWSRS